MPLDAAGWQAATLWLAKELEAKKQNARVCSSTQYLEHSVVRLAPHAVWETK